MLQGLLALSSTVGHLLGVFQDSREASAHPCPLEVLLEASRAVGALGA